MNFVLQPWHIMILVVSAWVNREQAQAIEYLMAENKVIREKLGKGRILLNDDQRRRLAVKGKVLGRKALSSIATIVSPDTILRWRCVYQSISDSIQLVPTHSTLTSIQILNYFTMYVQ